MANELYRQGIHLLVGALAAIAAFALPKTAFLWATGLLLVLILVGMFAMPRALKWVFIVLEREHVAFKGKGGFFFVLGLFLTGLLFYEQAGWAILVLAIPDSIATIIGTLFHSPELPYNHRKTFLGSGAFFVSALLVLVFAHQGLEIVFIAFLVTALESFDYREIPFLDDNLVIPVITAWLLSLL
jgi:dolichol kinase